MRCGSFDTLLDLGSWPSSLATRINNFVIYAFYDYGIIMQAELYLTPTPLIREAL